MSEHEKPTLFRPGLGKRGINELHWAAYCGDMNELVRQLEAGSDPNKKDDYRGYAAVHWLADLAATGGPRVQMLRRLVDGGASIMLQSSNGETALSLARATGSALGEALEAELLLLGTEEAKPSDA
jgi:ankyrin repeat protein